MNEYLKIGFNEWKIGKYKKNQFRKIKYLRKEYN